MGYLILVTCLSFIVVTFKFDRRFYNPIVLFNLWWGITVFISSLGLFEMYVPSNKTFIIMLVAIISFNGSILFLLFHKDKSELGKKITINQTTELKLTRILTVIQFLAVAILLNRSITVVNLLMGGLDYSRIRYEYFYTESIMKGYAHLINMWFIDPLTTFSMIYISIQIFQQKYNKLLIGATTLSVGLIAFSSGGRSIVLTFLIIISLAYILNYKKMKLTKISKIVLTSFGLLLILGLVYMTIARMATSGGVEELLQVVVLYFTGPFLYFEKLSPLALDDQVLLFGGTFFGGLVDIFLLGLKFIGFDNILTMGQYVGEHNQEYFFLGEGQEYQYNAFPTMIYNFLYDFHYLGVIIGPLLFGFISVYFYRKMIITNSLAYQGIYIMIVIMIYESVMKWSGLSASPWIVIILFLLNDYFVKKDLVIKK